MTHICLDKLTIIVSDNGLSPGRRQAIIWTNAGILLIGPSGINFSEILIESTFEKVVWVMAAICLGLNVLIRFEYQIHSNANVTHVIIRQFLMRFL